MYGFGMRLLNYCKVATVQYLTFIMVVFMDNQIDPLENLGDQCEIVSGAFLNESVLWRKCRSMMSWRREVSRLHESEGLWQKVGNWRVTECGRKEDGDYRAYTMAPCLHIFKKLFGKSLEPPSFVQKAAQASSAQCRLASTAVQNPSLLLGALKVGQKWQPIFSVLTHVRTDWEIKRWTHLDREKNQ